MVSLGRPVKSSAMRALAEPLLACEFLRVVYVWLKYPSNQVQTNVLAELLLKSEHLRVEFV